MKPKKTVVIGLLGTVLDAKEKRDRWEKWRPTVSIFQQEDLLVHRLELLHQQRSTTLAEMVAISAGLAATLKYDGVFTMQIKGDGPVRLLGMVLERSTPGLVYDTLGINGAQVTTPLLWEPAIWSGAQKQAKVAGQRLAAAAEAGNTAPIKAQKDDKQTLLEI